MVTSSNARVRGVTVQELKELAPGAWLSDPAARGVGVLQARKLSGGQIAFYLRYTHEGERHRLPLGVDIALSEARQLAQQLSIRYQRGERDLKGALDAEERERKRVKEAEVELARAKAAADMATLGALMDAYVEDLRLRKATTADSVERAIVRHLRLPWPVLWGTPINSVTPGDIVSVLAMLTKQGKDREAAKLRSYMIRAFKIAITAPQNPKASASLRKLNVTHNPAADVMAIEGANRARERALSEDELRAYWKKICVMTDEGGALLRFHLLTGCQRLEQLARVTKADVSSDRKMFTIADIKGRRSSPRAHSVPLSPAALEALQGMGGELGPYIFSLTRGVSGASPSAVYRRVQRIEGELISENLLTGGHFSPGDLRRTVESVLAGRNVSKEVRAQLQSHGIGGVQDKHYNRHDFLDQKRSALETLFDVLSA